MRGRSATATHRGTFCVIATEAPGRTPRSVDGALRRSDLVAERRRQRQEAPRGYRARGGRCPESRETAETLEVRPSPPTSPDGPVLLPALVEQDVEAVAEDVEEGAQGARLLLAGRAREVARKRRVYSVQPEEGDEERRLRRIAARSSPASATSAAGNAQPVVRADRDRGSAVRTRRDGRARAPGQVLLEQADRLKEVESGGVGTSAARGPALGSDGGPAPRCGLGAAVGFAMRTGAASTCSRRHSSGASPAGGCHSYRLPDGTATSVRCTKEFIVAYALNTRLSTVPNRQRSPRR